PPNYHHSIADAGTQYIEQSPADSIHRSVRKQKKAIDHPIFRVTYRKGLTKFADSHRQCLAIEVVDSCSQCYRARNPPTKVFDFHAFSQVSLTKSTARFTPSFPSLPHSSKHNQPSDLLAFRYRNIASNGTIPFPMATGSILPLVAVSATCMVIT